MKTLLLKVAAVAALFILIGCGTNDSAEDDIKWSDDNGGTLEVLNGSNKDIVVFKGATPTNESIMGGIRAGTTKAFDVSKETDFNEGGYMVIRGITREEYNDKKGNLVTAKWQFNAFATYKRGQKYRVQIDDAYMGNYAVKVTNLANFGVELRKNSPEGEKIAYLPRLKVNEYVYFQKPDGITLFPVYVAYNRTDQEIITLEAKSMFDASTVGPLPVDDPDIANISFPVDPNASWNDLLKDLKSPVAYITVSNNVAAQAGYFTNAGTTHYLSQEGYDVINSGNQRVFEIKAVDEEENPEGIEKDLVAKYYNGAVLVPVLMKKGTEYIKPSIKNGYNYTVSVTYSNESGAGPQDRSNYKAIIVEGRKRDISNQLESP
ncbi:MAG: hypothetical protein LBH25_09485 [Fibromonadaceae bacterium]|nr:hypothetical protein [Fibromonadaceae bacterium]